MNSVAILLDREDEREAIDTLLHSASEGSSGALVVYGEAGMGKSALLDYAASSSDLAIARVQVSKQSAHLDLRRSTASYCPSCINIDRLPPPQRVALESAFGLLDRGPPDRFMVSLASLTLLSVANSQTGLLGIVDDAQWIDTESLQALAFAARRFRLEGIALLIGVRTATDLPSELAGLPTLEVPGLPENAGAELLRIAAGRPVPEQVAKRIVRGTSGCPLALRELGDYVDRAPI